MLDFKLSGQENSGMPSISPTKIKVIGCGGGGSSAVNRMIQSSIKNVDFVAINTDLQALYSSTAPTKLPIGQKITGGLGAGGNPEVGEKAAEEDSENIANILEGTDMVIITAGMGGGTGTGSAPIVAKLAHEAGILTIAVVTTPFGFEGPVRMNNAVEGLKKLKANVDSMIVIPNEQIVKISDEKLNFFQAFKLADDVLTQGVQGISEIITVTGVINLDFNDVKTVMKGSGEAILGVGFGEGDNRALKAAQGAIFNPLFENRTIDGAKQILVNIVGNQELKMTEIDEIVNNIKASADKNVNVIVGLVYDASMGEKVRVTVIATGFDSAENLSVEDEVNEAEDVVSADEFESLFKGKDKENTPESSQKIQPADNTISFSNDDLFNGLDKKSSPELNIPQNTAEKPVFNVPNGNINRNDINTPACLRYNLNNLSKSIDLSE